MALAGAGLARDDDILLPVDEVETSKLKDGGFIELGLKVDQRKAAVELLVIDRADQKPAEN